MTDAPNMQGSDAAEQIGLPPGTKIGKYEIVGRIAIGGQAIVYKGYDTLLDRQVAIKQISSHLAADPRFLDRFRREAQLLAKLGSEQSNIVAVYDLVHDATGLYIVMEHLEGHTLRAILDHQQYAIPVQPALEILWHIASGLRAAHAQGIVHRDIKPANIIVNRQYRAKITDFGVAATKGGQESMTLGTTKYMAPELFEGGPVDARVDIYSLGFIAYEMLTGREYFTNLFSDVLRDPHSENLRWMKWHSDPSSTVPPLAEINSAVPKPLSDIVARMMSKDPNGRYATIEEVMAEVRAAVGGKKKRSKRSAAAGAATAGASQALAAGVEGDLELPPEGAESPAGEPTAEIPKEPMALRKKIIFGATAAVLAIVIGIVLAVMVGSGARARDRQARAAYIAAFEQSYTEAMRIDKIETKVQKFKDAGESFGKVATESGELPAGKRAAIRQQMSEAYAALYDEQWDKAELSLRQAKGLVPRGAEDYDREFGNDIKGLEGILVDRRDRVGKLRSAEAAIEEHDWDAARSSLDQVLTNNPSRDIVERSARLSEKLAAAQVDVAFDDAMAKATAALGRKDFPAAAEECRKAGELKPNDPRLQELTDRINKATEFDGLVLMYEDAIEQADFRAARMAAEEMYKIFPTDENKRRIDSAQSKELFAQAQDEQKKGNIPKATEAVRKAIALDPDNAEYVQFLEALGTAGEYDRYMRSARLAFRNKQWDKAIADATKAGELKPGKEVDDFLANANYEKHLAAGDEARLARKYDEAVVQYELARADKPDDPLSQQKVVNRLELVKQAGEYELDWTRLQQLMDKQKYSEAALLANAMLPKEPEGVPQGQTAAALNEAKYRQHLKSAIDTLGGSSEENVASATPEALRTAANYLEWALKMKEGDEAKGLLQRIQAELAKRGRP